MAIIYSYPTVVATLTDLVLGTDISSTGKPTKNFTVQSLIDLVPNNLGDLQAVLDIGNTATGGNANITLGTLGVPTGTVSANSFTTSSLTISGANLITTGFVTALNLTGTLLTNAQPNVSSLGTLTSLAVNTSVTGTAVVTTLANPGNDLQIASTKAIVDYIATNPNPETLANTLQAGNTTTGGGFSNDIIVSAGDDITFTNTSKLLLGTTAADTLEIYGDSADSFIIDNSPGQLRLKTSSFAVQDLLGTSQIITGVDGGSVELYEDNIKKIETSTLGATISGAISVGAGGFALPSYNFTGDPNTGIYQPAADQIGLSTNGVTRLTVINAGVEVTGLTISDSFKTDTSTGGAITKFITEAEGIAANDTDTTVPSSAAVKDYVDTSSGAVTLDYAGDATGPFALNLGTDDLEFNGDANITVTAAAVAATLGVVTIDLNDDVTISGILQAGTLSDGTFSGTAGTYTGGVSITSSLFVGPLTGNASTATSLAAGGALSLLGDATGGPATYTNGGAINITTAIADTVVTGKVLTGYNIGTSGAISAADTILEAFEKIQATITGLPEGGIDYIGAWDASGGGGGSPDLTVAGTHVAGHYYVVNGDSPVGGTFPNGGAVGPSEWKIGDWVIRGDSTIALWQKIDNTSSIEGTGATNKIARWTSAQILGTGLITDDLSTVTIGNTGELVVEGNTTLGNATGDTVLVKGTATFEVAPVIELGLGVGVAAAGGYGGSGQVLTSGGANTTAMTWTSVTTGTIESFASTHAGTAFTSTVTNPNGAATSLAITMNGASGDYINGDGDFIAFPVLDNYIDWKLQGDGGTNQDITKQTVVDFAGGTKITTATTADTLTINHDAQTNTPGTPISESPAFGGTFTAISAVPVDATGHLTGQTVKTITIPANPDFIPSANGTDLGIHGLVPAPGAGTGSATYFLNGTGAFSIPPDLKGVESVTATTPIVSSNTGSGTTNITHATSGVAAGSYLAADITVNDKGHITAAASGGGTGGGTFTGDQSITTTSPTQKAFTLNRATTGTLIFDVWLTSETSIASSVAKKYTVAHANNATPVYNKIIDTGPAGSNDFTVSFVNAGAGLSIECYILGTGIATQNIGYTVQVGHDSTNTLTFTAAS